MTPEEAVTLINEAKTPEYREFLKWLYHPVIYGGPPRLTARGGNSLLNREELRDRNGGKL